MKPFIKWPGGKTQLLDELREEVPKIGEGSRYFEVFAGGAALFFSLAGDSLMPKYALINDVNAELITAYQVVRDQPEKLLSALLSYKLDEENYYYVRDEFKPKNDIHVASRFVYLNKCGFNGLYRVNKHGKFNVPFGKHSPNLKIADASVIMACSRALQGVSLHSIDFELIADRAWPGDFVYFDPPYVPRSETANFTAYTKSGFSKEDHERLMVKARSMKRDGVNVMLSNADTRWVRKLYSDFTIRRVSARRNINSKADARGDVGELIIT